MLTEAGLAVEGVDIVEIHHDAANVASGRIPEKLGYTEAQRRDVEIDNPGECGVEVIVRKDVVILRDADRATAIGDELVARGYRGMTGDMLAYGGVDATIEKLAAFRDLGVDEIVIRCMSIDQADALETIELAGEVRAALAD
jgi:hypothetical protein